MIINIHVICGGVILLDGLGPFLESYGHGPFFESYNSRPANIEKVL